MACVWLRAMHYRSYPSWPGIKHQPSAISRQASTSNDQTSQTTASNQNRSKPGTFVHPTSYLTLSYSCICISSSVVRRPSSLTLACPLRLPRYTPLLCPRPSRKIHTLYPGESASGSPCPHRPSTQDRQWSPPISAFHITTLTRSLFPSLVASNLP